eukprot:5227812-Alexandrium_andersonii.AAC.1
MKDAAKDIFGDPKRLPKKFRISQDAVGLLECRQKLAAMLDFEAAKELDAQIKRVANEDGKRWAQDSFQ